MPFVCIVVLSYFLLQSFFQSLDFNIVAVPILEKSNAFVTLFFVLTEHFHSCSFEAGDFVDEFLDLVLVFVEQVVDFVLVLDRHDFKLFL